MRRVLLLSIPMLALATLLGIARTQTASAQTLGTQVCSPSTSLHVYQALQTTCPVTAPSQLVPPQTVYITSPTYNAATPVACQGIAAGSYATQGTTVMMPTAIGLSNTGQTACSFQVASGIVPAGALVGTEVVAIPYSVSGSAVQLSSYVCGDPTCGAGLYGTGISALQPPPPPVLVTISNSSSCISPYAAGYAGTVSPYANPYVPFAGVNNAYLAYGNSVGSYACGAPTPPVTYPHYGDYDNDGD